jgi:hypothetical protein
MKRREGRYLLRTVLSKLRIEFDGSVRAAANNAVTRVSSRDVEVKCAQFHLRYMRANAPAFTLT